MTDAIRILFSGDLILLRDMVEAGSDKKTGRYDYSFMFDPARKYIQSADYAVGVLEGPLAGVSAGWSNTDLHDLKPGEKIALNFPDAFAEAIGHAGFDLVTTATNHLFDKGRTGVSRTLEVLDRLGIGHVGTGRSAEEPQAIKVVTVGGVRIAFLAYTATVNYIPRDYFITGEGAGLTHLIAPASRPFYDECRRQVAQDFERAKALRPDLIVVLPHVGMEFLHEPDAVQKDWCDYFVELGADIVLSAHPHTVQPIVWRKRPDGRRALVAYCASMFVNSYIDRECFANMLTEVEIDAASKKLKAARIIPTCAWGSSATGYCCLPIYDALRSADFAPQLTSESRAYLDRAHRIVSKVVLGNEIPSADARASYEIEDKGEEK